MISEPEVGAIADGIALPTDAVLQLKAYLLNLQAQICQALESLDGQQQFTQDAWERPLQGEGRTHALENGKILEKCGVNFSHVYGTQLPAAATSRHPELAGQAFEALGLSLIIHPRNPYAPTTHFNVRFFCATASGTADTPPRHTWWFGGGFDLTPYYGFTEDCQHFHAQAKAACDPFGSSLYPQFKQWADTYFFLKHRNEARGIGGIFFDDFRLADWESSFDFVRSVGDHFLPAYLPLVERRMHHPYGERERAFQSYRRGRYVEFNLIYDRGTLFGLQFGGRTESILISLPPEVHWRYDWRPEPNTAEAALYSEYLPPRDWLNE